MSYELCSHTIIRPFQGDELIRDEFVMGFIMETQRV